MTEADDLDYRASLAVNGLGSHEEAAKLVAANLRGSPSATFLLSLAMTFDPLPRKKPARRAHFAYAKEGRHTGSKAARNPEVGPFVADALFNRGDKVAAIIAELKARFKIGERAAKAEIARQRELRELFELVRRASE